MAKNLVYIGVVVLAIIAVFLGYKIYQQQKAINSQTTDANQQVKNNSSSPINSTVQSTATQSNSLAQNIDLDSVFKQFPTPNSSKEERTKFNDYLLSIGQRGNTLTISNCRTTPMIFIVKKGSEFTISNLDSTNHTLNVGQLIFSVNAKQTKKVTADGLEGSNGYFCDGTGQRVGILHIVQ